MATPTKAQLDQRYKGIHILVIDEKHADYGKKCSFVEMIKKTLQKGYLMRVKIMTEDRTLDLHAAQIFVITAEIPLPSPKDN